MALVSTPATASEGTRPLGDRARLLVILSTMLMVVGMLLGMKLTGRFALSNVAQLAGTAMLFIAIPRLLRRKDIILFGAGIASFAIAAVSVSIQYEYTASVFHISYFLISAIYLVGIYRACAERSAGPAVAEGIRRGIPVALCVLLTSYAFELAQGVAHPTLGFDDKSHGSVAACLLAFATLRFLRSPYRILIALGLFGVALLTPSRLPFFFAPFLVLALIVEYQRIRKSASAAWQVFLAHLVLGTAVVAPLAVLNNSGATFASGFDRVIAQGGSAAVSTESHLDLLTVGWLLKIESIWNVLLGVTPGGFASTAYASDIDLMVYRLPFGPIADGTAPLHSTFGSVFLEFPLWFALLVAGLSIHATFQLIRRKEVSFASFFVALLGATVFYSSHNELFFMISLVMVIVLAYSEPPLGDDPASAEAALRRQKMPTG